jgi:hypothetical protein
VSAIILAVVATAEARAAGYQSGPVAASAGVLAKVDHPDEATRQERLGRMALAVLSAPRRPLPDGNESVQLPLGSRFVVVRFTTDGEPGVAIVSGWEWALAQAAGGLELSVFEPVVPRWSH